MPDVVPGAVGAKLEQASLRQVGADRYVRACLTSIVSRTGAFDQEDAYRERLPVERLQHDLVKDSLRVRVRVRVRVKVRVRVRVRVGRSSALAGGGSRSRSVKERNATSLPSMVRVWEG